MTGSYSPPILGTFERNIGGVFVYKHKGGYFFVRAQGMAPVGIMPRSFNIWQDQLRIWLLAKGWF